MIPFRTISKELGFISYDGYQPVESEEIGGIARTNHEGPRMREKA